MDDPIRYARIKKVFLILLAIMVPVFSVLYLFMGFQKGTAYHDTLFRLTMDGETVVYSAKVKGRPISFSISPDGAVTCRQGETVYGPYTIREDPSAAPGGELASMGLTGVEILEGDEVLFRGGYLGKRSPLFLTDRYGKIYPSYAIGEKNGLDRPPQPLTILYFSLRPEPDAHRGHITPWFLATLMAGLAAVSIRFDDQLFRFGLSLRMRNAEAAEPSEWEIFSRYLSWMVLTAFSFGIYIYGLTTIS